MNKIDKRFLVDKPIVFVEREYYKAKLKARIYKYIFVLFNVFSMIATFAILTLSTLVVSKTLFNGVPSWYFYATTVVSAVITLITSLINFFYIKDQAEHYKKLHQYIQGEIIKHSSNSEVYKNNKHKDFEIFHRVNVKMGNEYAKEVDNARTS